MITLTFIYRTITFYGRAFQLSSISYSFSLCSIHNPGNKFPVWALSLSLAATQEIDVSFSSYGYLDVSVPRVPLVTLCIYVTIHTHYHMWVSPFGNLRVRICASNRSLSQLITSFIASVSLGIRHTPFLTFFTTVFLLLVSE